MYQHKVLRQYLDMVLNDFYMIIPKSLSGNSYLARYAKMVSSADKGAILE